MWVERIVRRGFDPAAEAGGRAVDYLDLDWDQCRRVVKKNTRGGEAVRVLLGAGEVVRHGDVLRDDAAGLLVVNVLPCELVVATPADARQAAELALRLGNLHHPTQVVDTEIVFVSDEPAMLAMHEVGVPWTLQKRVFEPTALDGGTRTTLASGFAVIRSKG